MLAKRNWEIRLIFTEEEGKNTTEPWYTRSDVELLIRNTLTLGQVSSLLDLTLNSVNATADSIYY